MSSGVHYCSCRPQTSLEPVHSSTCCPREKRTRWDKPIGLPTHPVTRIQKQEWEPCMPTYCFSSLVSFLCWQLREIFYDSNLVSLLKFFLSKLLSLIRQIFKTAKQYAVTYCTVTYYNKLLLLCYSQLSFSTAVTYYNKLLLLGCSQLSLFTAVTYYCMLLLLCYSELSLTPAVPYFIKLLLPCCSQLSLTTAVTYYNKHLLLCQTQQISLTTAVIYYN